MSIKTILILALSSKCFCGQPNDEINQGAARRIQRIEDFRNANVCRPVPVTKEQMFYKGEWKIGKYYNRRKWEMETKWQNPEHRVKLVRRNYQAPTYEQQFEYVKQGELKSLLLANQIIPFGITDVKNWNIVNRIREALRQTVEDAAKDPFDQILIKKLRDNLPKHMGPQASFNPATKLRTLLKTLEIIPELQFPHTAKILETVHELIAQEFSDENHHLAAWWDAELTKFAHRRHKELSEMYRTQTFSQPDDDWTLVDAEECRRVDGCCR